MSNQDRLVTKQQMLDRRGGKQYAICDLCFQDLNSSSGIEMHELIHRSQTQGNEEAQQLSFAAPICSLLCSKCHHQIHHIGGVDEKQLWVRNIDIYGYHEVVKAYDAVEQAMKSNLYITSFKDASNYGLS